MALKLEILSDAVFDVAQNKNDNLLDSNIAGGTSLSVETPDTTKPTVENVTLFLNVAMQFKDSHLRNHSFRINSSAGQLCS